MVNELFAVLERIATAIETNNALLEKLTVEKATPVRKRIETAVIKEQS